MLDTASHNNDHCPNYNDDDDDNSDDNDVGDVVW